MTSGTTATKPTLSAFWHDLPREGRLLLSIVVLEFVGHGLVLPFWVVYLHEVRGFALGTAGLLLGFQALVGLVTVGPAGTLIDRFGARIVLISCLVSVIAGEIVIAFAATPSVAAIGLALTGISFGASFPASQALVATIVPTRIRQRYFGVNFTLLNLGIGIGGLLGGAFVDVEKPWTFQLTYLLDAVTFVPALFLILVPLRHVGGPAAPTTSAVERPSYAEVLRLPGIPVLLVLSFVASFVAYAQLNSGMPAFARAASGVSTQGIGIAFACNTAVIVLMQLLVLQRIEGHRRTRVMAVMAAVWAGAWLLLGASGLVPGTTGATVLVAACASVFAFGEMFLQPTLPAITNDLATDQLRGRVNAIGSAAFQLPMVIGPPVAGWLIGHDLEAVYVALLVVGCGLLALLALTVVEPRIGPTANGIAAASREPDLPAEPLVVPAPLPATTPFDPGGGDH